MLAYMRAIEIFKTEDPMPVFINYEVPVKVRLMVGGMTDREVGLEGVRPGKRKEIDEAKEETIRAVLFELLQKAFTEANGAARIEYDHRTDPYVKDRQYLSIAALTYGEPVPVQEDDVSEDEGVEVVEDGDQVESCDITVSMCFKSGEKYLHIFKMDSTDVSIQQHWPLDQNRERVGKPCLMIRGSFDSSNRDNSE